jgi:hypothetical protein
MEDERCAAGWEIAPGASFGGGSRFRTTQITDKLLPGQVVRTSAKRTPAILMIPEDFYYNRKDSFKTTLRGGGGTAQLARGLTEDDIDVQDRISLDE